jgi:hypothetical protein
MLTTIRQGIVSKQESIRFIALSNGNVNLNADSSPTIFTLAHGVTDYLHTELETVANAWVGPFSRTSNYWLYVDIDTTTAVRTFGKTTLEPTFGRTQPTKPSKDQHFFDTTINKMLVWTGSYWKERIRVFTSNILAGKIAILDVGSQIKLNQTRKAGEIIFDVNDEPVMRSYGSFLTSETIVHSSENPSNSFKLEQFQIKAKAIENIPKFHAVTWKGPSKLGVASYIDIVNGQCVGVSVNDIMKDDINKFATSGHIYNGAWNFSKPAGTLLFVGLSGEITTDVPDNTSIQIVGKVVTPNTIFLDIRDRLKINAPVISLTPTPTATGTVTPTPTATGTVTPTLTAAPTLTPTLTPTYTPTTTLTPSPTGVSLPVLRHSIIDPNPHWFSNNDSFGYTVSTWGNYAIVGAPKESYVGTEDFASDNGIAYIINVNSGDVIRTLYNPNDYSFSEGDEFGAAVAMHGNRALISAIDEETEASRGAGVVYMFDVGTGEVTLTLRNPNLDTASEAFGSAVALSDDYCVIGAYRVGDFNDGEAYVYSASTGTLLHTLVNPNPYGLTAFDNFGFAVAASGRYAIVGAPYEDNGGVVYVYDMLGTTPATPTHTILNPNLNGTTVNGTLVGDRFGNAVAIDGNYLIVGAPDEVNALAAKVGAIYIYDLTSGTPTLTYSIPSYNNTTGGEFGSSVSLSGNYAVVGATEGNIYGMAYLINVTTGLLEYTFDYPGTGDANQSWFGFSVSISNETVIVGAPYESNNTLSQYGGASYIYNILTVSNVPAYTPATTNTVTPTPTASYNSYSYTLNNPYAAPTDLFYGYAIALYGDLLCVGAPAYNNNNGEVYVYDILTGTLLETISNPLASTDEFGMSLEMNANYLIIRSETNVYAYNASTRALLFTFNVAGSNLSVYGQPSRGIGLSGAFLIVGDTLFDGAAANTGRAYIYDMAGGTPTTPIHTFENPNAHGTALNDYFGSGVAMDGNSVIIGAMRESEDVVITGFSITNGKAYIYDLTSGTPTIPVYTLDNPTSSTALYFNYDYFGASVAIEGNVIAVGAPFASREGQTISGSVYLYDASTGGLTRTINNPAGEGYNARFGASIKIYGSNLMVGAEAQKSLEGSTVGKAYIYDIVTGDLKYQYDNPVTGGVVVGTTFDGYAAFNYFGHGIAISENYAVVGAYNTAYGENYASFNDGTGRVYVYRHVIATPTPTPASTLTPTPTLTVNASVTPTVTPTPTPVYEFLSGDIIATVVPASQGDIYTMPNSNVYHRYLLIATYSSAEVLAITGGNTTVNILGMEFDVDLQPDNQPFPDYGIGMKLTTNDITLDNSGTNGGTFTIVKSPSPESFTTGVVKEFTFDTPLQWTEGNNLVVSWAWGDTTAWTNTGYTPSGAGIMYINGLDTAGTFAVDDPADWSEPWRPVFRLKLSPV